MLNRDGISVVAFSLSAFFLAPMFRADNPLTFASSDNPLFIFGVRDGKSEFRACVRITANNAAVDAIVLR
jgi:hypothetical protein